MRSSAPIALLPFSFDVAPLNAALDAAPELWNQHTARTADPASPHHGLDDIWVRFAAPGVDGSKEHDAVWYESPIVEQVKQLAYRLMANVRGDRLGGVLITRIPAGEQCKPHIDPGWHARYYEKFAVQLRSVRKQKFCFEGVQLSTLPGDVFWFDNSQTHWVTNDTLHERITLIVCIRPDGK